MEPPVPPRRGSETAPAALASRLAAVRARTDALAAPLSPEDCQAQSMPDASPVKWHLAHTTWFFETLVLARFEPGFRPFDPTFRVLFNSYYQGVGDRHPRPQRGLLTRPDLATVRAWRAQVDARLAALLARPLPAEALALLELGLQHEQQHQELILTDVKHLLSCHPADPVYTPAPTTVATPAAPAGWFEHPGGLVEIGHAGAGFGFDHEQPRHAVWLRPFALAGRPVVEAEWAEFVADGGYRDPRWWLAAGWDWVQAQRIEAPAYHGAGGQFTLHGRRPPDPAAPVVHVSYFEAEAYARWRGTVDAAAAGARLPSEAEWEAMAAPLAEAAIAGGQFADGGLLHPAALAGAAAPRFFAGVWEWTASAYLPYPGYRPWAGAVGEYNGKFMIDQMVLRGASCATPRSHARASYRNFFPAAARWQFSGLRLARDNG